MRHKAAFKPKYDLAVMDWGIGGLSVYNEIRRLQPGLSILYFSDSGHMPYGKTPALKMKARLNRVFEEFAAQGIRHIVVACNAASTALPALEKSWAKRGVFVTGVIDRGVELVKGSRARRVAVIGGKRTIVSGSFSRPFRGQVRMNVRGRIAQPLSALIEAGELRGPKLESALRKILTPLRGADALLLACTHYPAVEAEIRKVLPRCRMLDPSRATAIYVKREWKLKRSGARKSVFWTTGNPAAMRRAGWAAFGVRISAMKIRL